MRVFILFVLLAACSGLTSYGQDIAASQKIDQLVEAALKKQGTSPNGEINDQVFLRRVYLDIAGRVPTIEESEAFHAESYQNKRERLIHQLINSEAHVSHAYHFWADLLRMNGGNKTGGALADAYELWVKNAIRENMPYDQMIYSLVTAEGKFWDNGAVGYYLRDRGMPLDNMSNTVRVFLGTRLECAQCHNHPFDKWTQLDYFKMASFSFGMNTKNYDAPNKEKIIAYLKRAGENAYMEKARELTGKDGFPYISNQAALDLYIKYTPEKTDLAAVEAAPAGDDKPRNKKLRPKNRRNGNQLTRHELLGMTKDDFVKIAQQCLEAAARIETVKAGSKELLKELYNPLQYMGVTAGSKDAQLPHDYQYTDAKPHQGIPADTMFGEDIDLATTTDSKIAAYGKWMTSSKNPTFTRVIVNRLWKEVFGMGIFEPVDELTDHTFVTNPELLSYLEKIMIDLKYDLRSFQEILYNTRTYQRAAFTGEVLMGEPYYFPGPQLRRMSAEQIWDSVVALALPEADRYQPKLDDKLSSIEKVKRIYQSLEERPFEEFAAMVEELAPLLANRKQIDDENRAKLAAAKESGDEAALRKAQQELKGSKNSVIKKISDIAYIHLQKKVDADDLLLAMGVMDVGLDEMDGELPENEGKVRTILTKLPKADFGSLPEDLKGGNRRARKNWQKEQGADHNVYRTLVADLARASELESPAKPGHFLRDFGQSDREIIENASDHASVPQALNLLNGPIVQALTNRYSVFGKRLHEAATPEEKARMIFQAMLTREPTANELELVKNEVAKDGNDAFDGIVWALLNTQQFIFIQ